MTDLERMAAELVAEAERRGVVVTIERRNFQPFAMGRAVNVVELRDKRDPSAEKLLIGGVLSFANPAERKIHPDGSVWVKPEGAGHAFQKFADNV